MDTVRIGHTGTFRTAQDGRTPQILEIAGVRVAHIAWTYGLNGVPVPPGREWSVNVFDAAGPDVSGLVEDAARARRAGSDVVIASVHCCEEYHHDPTRAQTRIVEALLAASGWRTVSATTSPSRPGPAAKPRTR